MNNSNNWKKLREMLKTPANPPSDYDWRTEPWVDDSKVRALSYYIANHLIVAMAADGNDKREERDEICLALLSPELTELVAKGPSADEVIDYRILCAAAMGIDKLITRWMETQGSVDAEGPKRRESVGEHLIN